MHIHLALQQSSSPSPSERLPPITPERHSSSSTLAASHRLQHPWIHKPQFRIAPGRIRARSLCTPAKAQTRLPTRNWPRRPGATPFYAESPRQTRMPRSMSSSPKVCFTLVRVISPPPHGFPSHELALALVLSTVLAVVFSVLSLFYPQTDFVAPSARFGFYSRLVRRDASSVIWSPIVIRIEIAITRTACQSRCR